MPNAYACDTTALRRIGTLDEAALRAAAWIDLLSPSEDDFRLVQRATGLDMPRETDLVEIERSSRLSADNGVLTLSMPLVTRLDDTPTLVAGGFVLSRDRLITIRFAPSRMFDAFTE